MHKVLYNGKTTDVVMNYNGNKASFQVELPDGTLDTITCTDVPFVLFSTYVFKKSPRRKDGGHSFESFGISLQFYGAGRYHAMPMSTLTKNLSTVKIDASIDDETGEYVSLSVDVRQETN